MLPSKIELVATILFFTAIIHTFLVSKIRMIANHINSRSLTHNFLHLLSEVEVVFAFWSFIFIILFMLTDGTAKALSYLDSLNFTEPTFVFVILCMAATRPVLTFAKALIVFCSKALPFKERLSFYVSAMIIGPILGSFITEPAAMTVTALILLKTIYNDNVSLKFKYATLALLFVNVSIGGTMTHFAAPPVLMVAKSWQWNSFYMFTHFGFKAAIAVVFSTGLFTFFFKHELKHAMARDEERNKEVIPQAWSIVIHLLFLALVVYFAHTPHILIGLFFIFLGFIKMTQKVQDKLKLRESLLVGLFLSGLIILGSMQSWWLKTVLLKMTDLSLFFGATALTAITDNAALTYLGSLVNLGESSKYALMAGALSGGGLTVIANAPNPIGYALLEGSFGKAGIRPLRLFLWALIPTLIAVICFLFL